MARSMNLDKFSEDTKKMIDEMVKAATRGKQAPIEEQLEEMPVSKLLYLQMRITKILQRKLK